MIANIRREPPRVGTRQRAEVSRNHIAGVRKHLPSGRKRRPKRSESRLKTSLNIKANNNKII